MNSLLKHNAILRAQFTNPNASLIKSLLDLDTIDLILRELLTIEEMREAGSFFTGQKLATKAISSLQKPITFSSVILDPTCGAGNLLIECSRKLGVESTLSQTLQLWGRVLWGFDIHVHFVEAAKLRLVIEALNRGVIQDCDLEEACGLLPNIMVRDAMSIESEHLITVTHLIMNPPFTIWPSPKNNYWKDGKVNAAGIVMDKILRHIPKGCCFCAILPDVLRSGSRYNGFRDFVSSYTDSSVEIWGRFNRKTDVDVFLLYGKVNKSSKLTQWHKSKCESTCVSDFFDVRTGPLVSYREPKEGNEYPYIYPKNSPQWETITKVTDSRQFKGLVIESPFIVIKRTSSPSDKYRASASIVNLKEPVAVENHMIVVKPKDGKISTCRALLGKLKSQQVNDFLNERIRVRHLTVGVVKEIPFCKDK
ncbi:restriction endonuclease subunit S [Shewanella algae]|uniref:restriction endonuclease subunit S n=1 Tax=Shewanella algae TaxID=38313 RepID=UPI0031F5522E